MLAHSFLIESSPKLLVTRTGIKARTRSISGLWFPWLKWDLTLAHWTQVSDRCPLGYLFVTGITSGTWVNICAQYNMFKLPVRLCYWSVSGSGSYVCWFLYVFWLQPFLDILWFWVTLFLNLIWDHLTRGRGDWSVCWSATGQLWFHFFLLLLFSVCQRRAVVFDCCTPWESFHC